MISIFLALFTAAPVHAAPNDFYGEFLAPGAGLGSRVRLEEKEYQSRYAAGQPFALEQTRFDAAFPITGADTVHWRGSMFTDFDAIQSGASFPNGRSMPNQLWDPGAGISRTQTFDGGKSLGGTFVVSSPSNHPFAAFNDLSLNFNATYKVPTESGNAWIFFLNFSNTRGYLDYVPLPGMAYYFHSGQTFRGLVGLPFLLLNWTPTELWSVTAFYFPVRNTELRATYGRGDGVQGYLSLSMRTRTYLMSDRTDLKERLFEEEGLAQLGVLVPVAKGYTLDLGGGQSFARRYFFGEKESDRAGAPTIRPDNELYLAAKAQASF